MIVCDSLEEAARAASGNGTALTIGVFDGLHLGHQALISETLAQAEQGDLNAAVMTFQDHPLRVLAPPFCPKRLLYADRKRTLLADMGADILLDLAFSREFAETKPEDFVKRVISDVFQCRAIVCGEDFTFGKDGGGNVALLEQMGQQLGFTLNVVQGVAEHDVLVKSTQIRDLLLSGMVEQAGALLSRPYELRGVVEHGHHRGRTIGFPTANIPPDPTHIVPARGVYVCAVRPHEPDAPLMGAMVNVGHAPTFGAEKLMVEAHILDFSGDLIGRELEVHFLHRLRDEQKFPDANALVAQLVRDRAESSRLIAAEETRRLMNLC